jgi:hypothetical protein
MLNSRPGPLGRRIAQSVSMLSNEREPRGNGFPRFSAILIDLDSGHFTPVVEPDHRSPIIIDSQFTKFIDFIDNSAGHSGHHGHNVYRSQDTSNFEQYWQIYGIVTCEFQLKLVLKQRSFKSSCSKMHLDVSGLSEIHEWLSNQIMHAEANTAPAYCLSIKMSFSDSSVLNPEYGNYHLQFGQSDKSEWNRGTTFCRSPIPFRLI